MQSIRLRLLLCLLLFPVTPMAQTAPSAPANPNASVRIPSVQATGFGSVQARPDLVKFFAIIATEDTNSSTATVVNEKAVTRLMTDLDALGLTKEEIDAKPSALSPVYRNDGTGKLWLLGYRSQCIVNVSTARIDKLGTIIEKISAAGAAHIGGLAFHFSDEPAKKAEARKKAIADAKVKAETYAAALNMKLGNVSAIVEQTEAAPPLMLPQRPAAPQATAGFAQQQAAPVAQNIIVPTEATDQLITAQVVVVWDLLL